MSVSSLFKGKDLTKFVRIERLEPDPPITWTPPPPIGQKSAETREYVPPSVQRPTSTPSGEKARVVVEEFADIEREVNGESEAAEEAELIQAALDSSQVRAERKIRLIVKDFPEYAEEFKEYPPTVRLKLIEDCITEEGSEAQIMIGGRVVLTFIESFMIKKGYPLQGYAERTLASPDFRKAFYKSALMYKPTLDSVTGGMISHPLVALAGAMVTTGFTTMNNNAHNMSTESTNSIPSQPVQNKQQTTPPAPPVEPVLYDN